jgi:hypothetical protein
VTVAFFRVTGGVPELAFSAGYVDLCLLLKKKKDRSK